MTSASDTLSGTEIVISGMRVHVFERRNWISLRDPGDRQDHLRTVRVLTMFYA